MAYAILKTQIEQYNIRLEKGMITKEAYEAFKVRTKKKMDVFMGIDDSRLTLEEYKSLDELFV